MFIFFQHLSNNAWSQKPQQRQTAAAGSQLRSKCHRIQTPKQQTSRTGHQIPPVVRQSKHPERAKARPDSPPPLRAARGNGVNRARAIRAAERRIGHGDCRVDAGHRDRRVVGRQPGHRLGEEGSVLLIRLCRGVSDSFERAA